MKEFLFKGAATALYTPFTKGKINFDALGKLIAEQVSAGIEAVVILGTTGEAATISDKERTEMIGFSVDAVNKRIPLIVGCGSNDTEKAAILASQAKKLGADGALCVTPYYNKCNQYGLVKHYEYISDKSDFPVIAYNVPTRTGVKVEPETLGKLIKIKNVIGYKEADGEKKNYEKTLGLYSDKIAIYSGTDKVNAEFMHKGASGCISVLSNIIPCKIIDIINNYENYYKYGDTLYNELCDAMFSDVNPIPLKSAVKLIRKAGYELRLPLTPLDKAKTEYLESVLNKIKAKGLLC